MTPDAPRAPLRGPRRKLALPAALLAAALLPGCFDDSMANQPKAQPYEASGLFADDAVNRPLPEGTVTRAGVVVRGLDDRVNLFVVNLPDPELDVAAYPWELTAADVEVGRQRFEQFCVMCHGSTGDGGGMVVERGYPRPPSLYERRLRDAAPGHVVNVVTHGRGAMYPHAGRVKMEDRWRLAAYVRALQLSTDRVDPPREATAGQDRAAGVVVP